MVHMVPVTACKAAANISRDCNRTLQFVCGIPDFSQAFFQRVIIRVNPCACWNILPKQFGNVNLKDVRFNYAHLYTSSFHYSSLTDVDFRGADITDVSFNNTRMDGIIMDETTSHFHMHCPEEGGFTGYKMAFNDKYHPYIVELKIPACALRSSATSNKCRCSEAKVMSITCLEGTDDGTDIVRSGRNPYFLYKAGETVKVDDFDENRWHECAPGIHFFMTRKEAVDYVL